jgi:DNA-binding transcriptional MerR regulator
MYTPGQVSKMLDIPPSTLRRLSKEFAAFLDKTPGRHRRYSESDINILRQARSMTGQGMTVETILQQLPIVETPPPAGDSLMAIPSIAAELARVDQLNRSLLGELESLKLRLDKLERLDAWRRLPFWRRWFTPPPK